jgi:hypothetical protein
VDPAWRLAPQELARLLRGQSQTPERVGNVEAAWQAFRAFLALPVDGLDPTPGEDADGFLIRWGRHGWNDGLPSLTFTRQFAVDARATWTEPDRYQPEYRQVHLEPVFPDAPALAGLDRLDA